jgi:hypothetical protein
VYDNIVYNLAADMGGMGFIVSNQSVLLYNNTMISFNMLEAARQNAAKRFFYSSTACVYNEALQMDPENVGLTEDMVWLQQDLYLLIFLQRIDLELVVPALFLVRLGPLGPKIPTAWRSSMRRRWPSPTPRTSP